MPITPRAMPPPPFRSEVVDELEGQNSCRKCLLSLHEVGIEAILDVLELAANFPCFDRIYGKWKCTEKNKEGVVGREATNTPITAHQNWRQTP